MSSDRRLAIRRSFFLSEPTIFALKAALCQWDLRKSRGSGAHLNEMPLVEAVHMDRGLQVRAEALFGPRVPALLRFSRDDFHIGAARKDRTLPGGVVLVRNHRQVRHLLYPLRNMAVELALEASAVDTGIVGFAQEQCVKPGALRAVRADPRLGYERFIVLRKRNGFEAEVHIALNPCCKRLTGTSARSLLSAVK